MVLSPYISTKAINDRRVQLLMDYISFTIDQKGLLLLTGEIIRVTNSRLGFTNKLFRISNLNFMSNCLVQVNAVEHNDSAYFVGNIKTASVAKEV